MGTFIYEQSNSNPFRDEVKGELQHRLIETLLQFGECALEQVSLYGKKTYVYDHKHLKKEEGKIILDYNRFENVTWDPSFMMESLDDFSGIRSTELYTKIGYRQHYKAIAVAKVLCECYSEGNYCVFGDISTTTIFNCLAYIGKKYGVELVKKFIRCRTDLEIMKKHEEYVNLFWGVRRRGFYFQLFMDSNFHEWQFYMKSTFGEDLENVEAGDQYLYIGTGVYLVSLLMKCLCEKELSDKLTLDQEQLLVELRAFVQRYYIDVIEEFDKEKFKDIDFSQYDDLKKYNSFFENMNMFFICTSLCDKAIFLKSVRNLLCPARQDARRADAEAIMEIFQEMLDEMIPDENKAKDLQEEGKRWQLYHEWKKEKDQEIKQLELLKEILEIAVGPDDISNNLISDSCLEELMLKYNGAEISNELHAYLAAIFSEERQKRFNESVREAEEQNKQNTGSRKLMNMAEEVMKQSDVIFPAVVFYQLLDNSFSETGEELLNKVEFYLKDIEERNQKIAFLWVLQDADLSKKYCF